MIFSLIYIGITLIPVFSMSVKLNAVQDIDIDTGKFKYILIKVFDPKNEEDHKYIVRGCSWAEYHGDIYDSVEPKVHQQGLKCDCVGGGRIIHNPDDKTIKVFGYSQGYGRADHQVTCDILKTKYTGYNITWTNDGY